MKTGTLMNALKEGKILFKGHHKDENNAFDTAEYLFFVENDKWGGKLESKGCGSACGTADDRLKDVFFNSELWFIHEFKLENGHPYPWSIDYNHEKKNL